MKSKTKKKLLQVDDPCPYKLVAIQAEDWTMYDSQNCIETIKSGLDLTTMWIAGYLIEEDEQRIIISQQIISKTNQARSTICVSKYSILQRIEYN